MQQGNKPNWLKRALSIFGILTTIIGIVAFVLSIVYPHNDIRSFQREIESGDVNGAIDIYQNDILGDASSEARAASFLNEQMNRVISNFSGGTASAQSVSTLLDTISAVNDVIQIFDTINAYYERYVDISESKAAFQLGTELYNSGDYKSAIDYFSQVIREDSENYEDAQEFLNESILLYQDSVIASAREQAAGGYFDKAYVIISEAERVIGSTPELIGIAIELQTLEFDKSISNAFDGKDYATVICEYAKARSNEGLIISAEIEDKYISSVTNYLENAKNLASEAFGNNKDYVAATNVLKGLLSKVSADTNVAASINSIISEYNEYVPIELMSLDYTQKGTYIDVGNVYVHDKDVNGNQYDRNRIICASGGSLNSQYASSDDEAYVLYFLNQNYTTLSGLIYRPYSSLSCDFEWTPATVRIYGDDILIYESPGITQETYDTIEFTIDVTGVRNLKIVMRGVWGMEVPGWVGLVEYYPKACLTNLMLQK